MNTYSETFSGDPEDLRARVYSLNQGGASNISPYRTSVASKYVITYNKFIYVSRYGVNSDVDITTTPEDIWGGGGIYTGFPKIPPETISVVSTSALDALAGTGARSVAVAGLGENWEELTEVINLNGLTPSNSIAKFRRVFTVTSTSVGALGANQGTLTCRYTLTAAVVFSVVAPGKNRNLSSTYTVPAGKRAFLQSWTAGIRTDATTNQSVNGSLVITGPSGVTIEARTFSAANFDRFSEAILSTAGLGATTDISMRVTTSTANNVEVSGGYTLLVENIITT